MATPCSAASTAMADHHPGWRRSCPIRPRPTPWSRRTGRDLDGTGAPGIMAATLNRDRHRPALAGGGVAAEGQGDGSAARLRALDRPVRTDELRFAYAPGTLGADAAGLPLGIGAENGDGTVGGHLVGLPTHDVEVTTAARGAGQASVSYTVTVRGPARGPSARSPAGSLLRRCRCSGHEPGDWCSSRPAGCTTACSRSAQSRARRRPARGQLAGRVGQLAGPRAQPATRSASSPSGSTRPAR